MENKSTEIRFNQTVPLRLNVNNSICPVSDQKYNGCPDIPVEDIAPCLECATRNAGNCPEDFPPRSGRNIIDIRSVMTTLSGLRIFP